MATPFCSMVWCLVSFADSVPSGCEGELVSVPQKSRTVANLRLALKLSRASRSTITSWSSSSSYCQPKICHHTTFLRDDGNKPREVVPAVLIIYPSKNGRTHFRKYLPASESAVLDSNLHSVHFCIKVLEIRLPFLNVSFK